LTYQTYHVAILKISREILGWETVLKVPEYNHSFLIANEHQIVVDGAELKANYFAWTALWSRLHTVDVITSTKYTCAYIMYTGYKS